VATALARRINAGEAVEWRAEYDPVTGAVVRHVLVLGSRSSG